MLQQQQMKPFSKMGMQMATMVIMACGGFACETRCPGGTAYEAKGGFCLSLSENQTLGCATCPDEKPYCVRQDSEPVCVACVGSLDCTTPQNPRCEQGMCVGCTANQDCQGILGSPICDTVTRTCRGCSQANEPLDCGAGTCMANGSCSALRPLSLGLCEACQDNRQCQLGSECVDTLYRGTLVGKHCIPVRTGAGGCLRGFPVYVTREGREYCTLDEDFTTCESLLRSGNTCEEGCGSTGVCGSDGFCHTACYRNMGCLGSQVCMQQRCL